MIIVDTFRKYEPRAKEYIKKPLKIKAVQMAEPFKVLTLEGTMNGKAGDYLVRGVKAELYPCDKEIFEETYAGVEAD